MAFSIATVRLVLFVIVTIFSVIVLGLGSHFIDIDAMKSHFESFWATFAVAIATLTTSTLPALTVIGLVREGIVFNYAVAEFTWLTVLWGLWLTSAIFTGGNIFARLPDSCGFDSFFFRSIRHKVNCGEFWAIHAFSVLIWLILTVYITMLLVSMIKQQKRGSRVWTKYVDEVDYSAPGKVIADMVEAPRTSYDMDKSEALV